MPASVAMPAVRQNRSKLAPTCCQASSTIAAGTTSAGVVHFVMALLSFVASAPRAYWLKAGNAYLTFSTSAGTSPSASALTLMVSGMSPRTADTETFWKAVCRHAGLDHDNYFVGSLGDSPEIATELADLVVSGIKRATASLARDYCGGREPIPKPGDFVMM